MKNPKKMELFQHIYSVYQKCLPENKLPSHDLMLDIYGKVIINTQEVSTRKNISMGSVVYLGASAIDHSCMPNTIWVGAQSFTSLMANLRQDINRISSISRCLNGTFP